MKRKAGGRRQKGILILAVGLKHKLYCKPSALCPLPSAFFTYSGDVLIPLRQDFAAERQLIEIEVTARHLTPEQLTEVITDATIRLYSRRGIALPGGGKTCELVKINPKKL